MPGFSYQASAAAATVTDGGHGHGNAELRDQDPAAEHGQPSRRRRHQQVPRHVRPAERWRGPEPRYRRHDHPHVSSIQRWFAGQTGGRHLRLDMSDDAVDITLRASAAPTRR